MCCTMCQSADGALGSGQLGAARQHYAINQSLLLLGRCVVAYFRENCVTIILAYKNHLRRACNNKCKMHKLAYIKRELLCEMRTADERTDRLLLPALPSINSHNLYVLLRGSARLCTNVICNCCVVDGRGSVGIINTLD